MAICRDNYGFGYLQAPNRTHLHWRWKMTAVGTPRPGPNGSTPSRLPLPSAVPEAAHVDELWIIKDKARRGGAGNPHHGPRKYDAPRTEWGRLARGDFEEYHRHRRCRRYDVVSCSTLVKRLSVVHFLSGALGALMIIYALVVGAYIIIFIIYNICTSPRYKPEPGSTFQMLYDFNRAEWREDGCGELAPDDGVTCAP
jgi:hypothetical protein